MLCIFPRKLVLYEVKCIKGSDVCFKTINQKIYIFCRHFNILDHGAVSHRSLQAPQSMRWAIRQPTTASSSTRPTAGSSSANPATSSGLIYIDPVNLRRSNAVSLNGAISSAVQTVQSAALSASQAAADESLASQTTSATANNLSRAFGIILRQVCSLENCGKLNICLPCNFMFLVYLSVLIT